MATLFTKELLDRKPLEEISIINNNQFSLLEKTSVKLLPILNTVKQKMANEDDLTRQSQNNS